MFERCYHGFTILTNGGAQKRSVALDATESPSERCMQEEGVGVACPGIAAMPRSRRQMREVNFEARRVPSKPGKPRRLLRN